VSISLRYAIRAKPYDGGRQGYSASDRICFPWLMPCATPPHKPVDEQKEAENNHMTHLPAGQGPRRLVAIPGIRRDTIRKRLLRAHARLCLVFHGWIAFGSEYGTVQVPGAFQRRTIARTSRAQGAPAWRQGGVTDRPVGVLGPILRRLRTGLPSLLSLSLSAIAIMCRRK
jgi:hypothetical protein